MPNLIKKIIHFIILCSFLTVWAGPAPQHIALLLPLTGNLSAPAKAVQNGFFAAYYSLRTQGYNPNIRVYNTADKNITAVYEQAQTDGADFIVGPLAKNDLQTLLNDNAISLPTLALNSLDNSLANKFPLYEFALSPFDEMQQVAKRLWQESHNRVLIIAPSDTWSQQIASAFEQLWQQFGGSIVKSVTYRDQSTLTADVRNALNIDQTENRARELQKLLNQKLRFMPHRRSDFDAVFLIADNNWARQIVPLLKFYFIGNTPIYSLSQIYPGNIDAERDHDLDQVIFDDMPWILDIDLSPSLSQIKNQLQSAWPKEFIHNSRLMALGVDAYLVLPQLNKLNTAAGIAGATGNLTLLENHHIYRELPFAQFKDGQPVAAKQAP